MASALLLSLPVQAMTVDTAIYQETLSATTGRCGDYLTWSFDANTGTMTISGTGAMDDYPNYAPPWVAYREQIQTLIVEPGVTTLGWSSFQWCSALTQVFLPDTLISLEYGALAYCSALESLYLPSSLKIIGIASFVGCTNLRHLTAPQGLTTIEDSAFIHCSGLVSLTLPKSLQYIGAYAFKDCSALSTIYYEGNATTRASLSLNGSYNSRFTSATWHYNNYTPDIPPELPQLDTAPQIPDWARPFTDFVANGIMPDISGENYDSPTQRGLMAFCLYNMLGNGVLLEPHHFVDVWDYDDAISWCYGNQVMSGVSDTEFSPDTPVTREQMAVMLWQCAQALGKEVDVPSTPDFYDQEMISSWAVDAMAWAVDQNLMYGNENYLYPGNTITRAETAVMLYQFYEMM